MKRTIHINIPFHKKQDTSDPINSWKFTGFEFSWERSCCRVWPRWTINIATTSFPITITYHYHLNYYHNYCYHHDNFCRARPLWTTFCARACLSHCSSSRRQIWRCPWSSFVHWALSLFLYNYFHNLIYIRCHPSPCPTAWTAYPCPFPFHQVILILITSITRCWQ